MSLTGPQRQQLQQALFRAFPTEASLRQMVMHQFSINLAVIAGGENLSNITFDLIQWAISQRRTDELIGGAIAANPFNPDLQAFAEQFNQDAHPPQHTRQEKPLAHEQLQEHTMQVFLCYAPADKTQVEGIYQKLQDVGLHPWMESKDILGGEVRETVIRQTIRKSDFLLVFLTDHAVNQAGPFHKAVKQALEVWQEKPDGHIYLIPVRLEDCTIPESLHPFQAIDMFEDDGWERLMRSLQEGIERLFPSNRPTLLDTKPTPTHLADTQVDMSQEAINETSKHISDLSNDQRPQSLPVNQPEQHEKDVLTKQSAPFITSIAFRPDKNRDLSAIGLTHSKIPNEDGCVTSVALHPDKNRILLAIGLGRRISATDIILLDISEKYIWKLQGHTQWVYSITLSPDGNVLATAGADSTIRFWNVQDGQEVQQLHGHKGQISCLAFSPDGRILASTGEDKTVRLWQYSTGQQERCLESHTDLVLSLAFSPNGDYLTSAGHDGIRLWDMQRGQEIHNHFRDHQEIVFCIAFSPDGELLAAGTANGTVHIWKFHTGKEPYRTLEGHIGGVNSVVFSPDGMLLTSGNFDTVIKLWDIQHGKEPTILPGHSSGISSVAFNSDGSLLASGSYDKTVRLWNRTLPQHVWHKIQQHVQAIEEQERLEQQRVARSEAKYGMIDMFADQPPEPIGERPDTKKIEQDIIDVLLQHTTLYRRDIYKALADEPYFDTEINKALRDLKKQGKIVYEGDLRNKTRIFSRGETYRSHSPT